MRIHGIEIHENVLTAKFACDYKVCKGYCCHPEDSLGCEIDEDERKLIEDNRELIAEYVCDEYKESFLNRQTYVDSNGVIGVCYAENGTCLLENGCCVLNLLRRSGKLSYGNPKVCGLYPLYYDKDAKHLFVTDFYENGICDCGYEKGEREDIHIVDFCKDALIKQFGESFYNELHRHIR